MALATQISSLFLLLLLLLAQNHPRCVVPRKNTQNVLLRKLFGDDRGIDCGTFFISHLAVLVIAPLHDIPDVQERDAVAVAAGQLRDLHFLLLLLPSQREIRQRLHFCDISNVPYLADAQLALQVAAESVHLVGITEPVAGHDH